FELFEEALAVHRESLGAFDVTVAPLMSALGFHERPAAGVAPARLGSRWIELDAARRTVRFLAPGVAIDLGAIGKGHALDGAAARLGEGGVATAFLHGGTSSVVGLGAPPGAPGWRVAIEPGDDAPVAILRDRALGVSAPDGRRLADGRGHVLDARTGEPVA